MQFKPNNSVELEYEKPYVCRYLYKYVYIYVSTYETYEYMNGTEDTVARFKILCRFREMNKNWH
jgi:hypothetical protein